MSLEKKLRENSNQQKSTFGCILSEIKSQIRKNHKAKNVQMNKAATSQRLKPIHHKKYQLQAPIYPTSERSYTTFTQQPVLNGNFFTGQSHPQAYYCPNRSNYNPFTNPASMNF
jgi:hypothetical protein